MIKKIFSILIFSFSLISIFFLIDFDSANALYRASDRISTSWPGAGSDHTIQFRTTENIPAGGTIIINFDDSFTFDADFDYSDVDFSFADNSSGPFIDRVIASSTSTSTDSVIVATSSKIIAIGLNSNEDITVGKYIKIEFGFLADFGENGDKQIINPVVLDSYGITIEIYDNSGLYIERAVIGVVMAEPVSMSSSLNLRYLGASPVGWLSYGTTQTVISMNTNYPARCRYSVASGTLFADMTNDFSYSSSTAYYDKHTKIVDGLTNGIIYEYYIRCISDDGISNNSHECIYSSASTTPFVTALGVPILQLNCIDYYIPFQIASVEGDGGDDTGDDGDNPDTDGDGTSSGGGSGTGYGGGAGGGIGADAGNYLPYPPPPGAPGVVFTGWAYSGAEVVVLQDGVEVGKALAGTQADFGAYLEVLNRGVYTFSLWANDSTGKKSNTFSTTFWMEAGTQTTISDIILSPTVSLTKLSVTAGQVIESFGQTVPDSTVEVWLYPEKSGNILDSEIIKKDGLVSANGEWSLFLNTDDLLDGSYLVKARATITDVGTSDFSAILKVNIGVAEIEPTGICEGADLNHDGKVNLTDFSILLYHWGTDDECADQNHDGTVNLTDFSIMLFYWTG